MEAKHTPGPWVADFEDGRDVNGMVLMAIKSLQGTPVAFLPARAVETPRARQHLVADALLIASAPDLLAALEVAKVALETSGPLAGHYPEPRQRHQEALAQVIAAIERAKA